MIKDPLQITNNDDNGNDQNSLPQLDKLSINLDDSTIPDDLR